MDTSLVAAGAAAGTAVMPGIGTAVGAVGGLLLGSMMGGGGSASQASAAPSSSAVGVYGSGLNGDNWNVAFGGSRLTATSTANKRNDGSPTSSQATGQGAVLPADAHAAAFGSSGLDSLQAIPSWAWIAIGGLVLWKLKSGH